MRKLNRRCGRLALAGAAAAALFAVGSAQAANQTWSGAGPDGNFTSTGNWAASAVPGLTTATSGSGDVATFANAVNTTVSVDAARSLT